MEDEDLRDSVRDAFEAARDAYDRLSSNGSVIDTAIDDKKLHKDLKETAENLRDATNRLRGKEKERHWGRLLLIGIAGAVLALVLSEDLRKAVLDKLFGAEEEFEYTSTTTPAPAPPRRPSSAGRRGRRRRLAEPVRARREDALQAHQVAQRATRADPPAQQGAARILALDRDADPVGPARLGS